MGTGQDAASRGADTGPRSASSRRGAIALFCALYLAVQIVVPSVALVDRGGLIWQGTDENRRTSGQTYFAWQMFSTLGVTSTYSLTFADGRTEAVDSRAELGRLRGRAHYDPRLIEDLCTSRDQVLEVVWLPTGFRTESVPC